MHQERVTALPTKPFAATGRGRRLAQFVNSPLKAKEIEKRKRLQELILSGQLPVPSEQDLLHNKPIVPCNRIIEKRYGDNNDNTGVKKEASQENLTGKTQVQDFERKKLQSLNGLYNMTRNSKLIGNDITQKSLTKDCNPVAGKASDIFEMNDSKSVASSGKESDWDAWEKSVVVEGTISDGELDELAIVDDNDDMNDVVVQQYIKALQEDDQPNNGTVGTDRKITPTRVQKVSKLKSTINADTLNTPPGTIPNPPKGMDRWGGSELKNVTASTGWGDLNGSSLNSYNDGVSIWDSASPGSKDDKTKASNTRKSSEPQPSNSSWAEKTKQIGAAVKSYNYSNDTLSDKQIGSKDNNFNKGCSGGGSYSRGISRKNTPTTTQVSKMNHKINGVDTKNSNSNKSVVSSGDPAAIQANDASGWGDCGKSKANDASGWGDCRKSKANDLSGWGDTSNHSKNWYDDGSSLWDSSSMDVTCNKWKL